jgi:SAM-dependent methyltransferase
LTQQAAGNLPGEIEKGMRILDVGCGAGDLIVMTSELASDSGEVVGLDISENALAAARSAIEEKRVSKMRFVRADIAELPEDIGTFDVIVGRRVLMYLSDASRCVNNLLLHLAANGKMIFQESDCMASSFCAQSMPLHTKVQAWIWDTVAREGGDIHIGRQLYSLMRNAKLKILQMRAEAILHTDESGSDLGWVAKMMAPRMISRGVATPEEMDADTLEDRLRAELKESGAPFIRDMVFGICAEK